MPIHLALAERGFVSSNLGTSVLSGCCARYIKADQPGDHYTEIELAHDGLEYRQTASNRGFGTKFP